jgi:hypothetical protein
MKASQHAAKKLWTAVVRMKLLEARSKIYDQFHRSSAGPAHFFLPKNADKYAAYYTSMNLIQDTGEAIMTHMNADFSHDPMRAYIEFWGVMPAIYIQQDAIAQIHQAVVENSLFNPETSFWITLRDMRNLCAGHPANRTHNVPAPQRTFIGRSFGNYASIKYEVWDAGTGETTCRIFNLRQMIDDYDVEAAIVLETVLSSMKSKWP